MATHPRIRSGLSLEEFLRWPRIDEQPYLEYLDGRIEERITGGMRHSVFMSKMSSALNEHTGPSRLGLALMALRCTFGGRSIVGDVIFLPRKVIRCGDGDKIEDEMFVTPGIHVEIGSSGEPVARSRAKLMGSVANGCPLGWFLDPDRETIDVFRPGLAPERLADDGFLDASPVLPDFRMDVSEISDWLIYGKPGTDRPGAGPS